MDLCEVMESALPSFAELLKGSPHMRFIAWMNSAGCLRCLAAGDPPRPLKFDEDFGDCVQSIRNNHIA